MDILRRRLDRAVTLLYSLPIMRTPLRRRASLAVASGLALLLVAALSGTGRADSDTGVTMIKVAGSADMTAPVPPLKPEQDKTVPDLPVKADLSSKDAGLYSRVFALQESGSMIAAQKLIGDLDNGILLGHVLAQRYLHPKGYRAEYAELADWLEKYADHPQAKKIYKLAVARAPGGTAGIEKPKSSAGYIGAPHGAGDFLAQKTYKSSRKRTPEQLASIKALSAAVRGKVQKNDAAAALELLKSDPAAALLDATEYESLRANIAAIYLFTANFDEAERQSSAAMRRGGKSVPVAGWVYGLANWKKGRFDRAAHGFEKAATSPYASGWLISASSYWAARAHLKSGHHRQVSKWLKKSAEYSRTFYGLLALRALGRDFDLDWDAPSLNGRRARQIDSEEGGKRAAALIRAGQYAMAETELARLPLSRTEDGRETLMAYALEHKLPGLAHKLGAAMSATEKKYYDAALYPEIPWEPQGGYRIDRALIHALVRQESKFDASAENPSGATGLMQLMPATARYIAGEEESIDTATLKQPDANLKLGQDYVESLLGLPSVGQDILSLAIAYNAGPGNLARWKSARKDIDDPLLFIETIPYAETRAFVEHVLSNYWIYRMRFDQDTPSLDAVVEGRWALYTPMDEGSIQIASR